MIVDDAVGFLSFVIHVVAPRLILLHNCTFVAGYDAGFRRALRAFA